MRHVSSVRAWIYLPRLIIQKKPQSKKSFPSPLWHQPKTHPSTMSQIRATHPSATHPPPLHVTYLSPNPHPLHLHVHVHGQVCPPTHPKMSTNLRRDYSKVLGSLATLNSIKPSPSLLYPPSPSKTSTAIPSSTLVKLPLLVQPTVTNNLLHSQKKQVTCGTATSILAPLELSVEPPTVLP